MGAIVDSEKDDDLIPCIRKAEQIILAMIGESVRYCNRDIASGKADSRCYERACDKEDLEG